MQNSSALFYKKLDHLQARVAKRMAQHFAALRNQPFQLLHEFQRYDGILRLERVQKELGMSSNNVYYSHRGSPGKGNPHGQVDGYRSNHQEVPDRAYQLSKEKGPK